MIWGRKQLQVLWRGGSPDHRQRRKSESKSKSEQARERERERESIMQRIAQEKLFPQTTDWEKRRG